MKKSLFATIVSFTLLSGCGGSGGESNTTPTPTPTPSPTPTPAPTPTPVPTPDLDARMSDAARLLNQASFGADEESISDVLHLGMEGWIDWQISLPASNHLDYVRSVEGARPSDELREFRIEAWWQMSVWAEDQLRQRVAFALSEIFVISERSDFFEDTYGITNYYDMLAEQAFGNYRDLLESVTLSPMMGMYLSMLGNQKPDLERNIRPDENYAREVMQLFSIGLLELNQDGSQKRDSEGKTIDTYDQEIIEGFAHIYTGWHFAGTTEDTWWNWWDNYSTLEDMEPVEAFHDKGEKTLLNDQVVHAGQTAEEDLEQALDNIFFHQNVAPFISHQLILKLVTSNPSPEYIGRVAAVFNDNGEQVRGDLGAVIKAILLDDEARIGHAEMPEHFGKLREPIIKATHLWRAFDAYSPNNRLQLGYPTYFFNQAPLSSPSVFNFYSPFYAPPGEISNAGLVSPEYQIVTENYVVRVSNFLAYSALYSHDPDELTEDEGIAIDLTDEVLLVDDPASLLQRLNILLMAGSMTEEMKEILIQSLEENEFAEPKEKVANLVFLIMNTPQYSIQK